MVSLNEELFLGNQMKIGIAAIGRLSEDTGGKNYILHFLRGIEELRPAHSFVLFVSEGEASKLGIEESDLVHIVTIPNSSRTPLHKVFAEQWKLPSRIVREKIDVMYYPGNFISLFSKVPAVVNIRSMAHAYPNYGVSGIRRYVRSILMPPSARKAQAVITPSEDIKHDVIRFANVNSAKIHVIPHGVNLELFDGERNRKAADSQAILDRYHLTSGNFLLYVSALWRYKRQGQLIRAHAELVRQEFPDLKLVIAGKGTGTDKKYLDEIYSLPKLLETEDIVIFTGGLPQSDLRYLYANAKAFVFPSSYESFGNPIFEAWASGIPIAVSNVHSFPEIAGDAALFFDPNDVNDIKDKISRLLSDSPVSQALVQRGAKRVKSFTWEAAIMRTLSLLENVNLG
jgi:glycosyltransferase involved in cell wall biosynthesis